MDVGFRSEPGCKKPGNEDNFFVDSDLQLFVVADGMGGLCGGLRASSIAVEEIAGFCRERLSAKEDPWEVLEGAVHSANEAILTATGCDPDCREMGCTVVAALISDEYLTVTHVGDSRAYLIKDSEIIAITEDHTHVAEWVKGGLITRAEARTHPARHGLRAALGIDEELEMDTVEWPWDSSSCLLLCSDGLTEAVEDHRLLDLVNSATSAQQACDLLVDYADKQGRSDDVTVVVVR